MAKIFSVFFILWLGDCAHFAIDVVDEILILFENVYDIYGDIQGASNSFKIHAYEQGEKKYMYPWQQDKLIFEWTIIIIIIIMLLKTTF